MEIILPILLAALGSLLVASIVGFFKTIRRLVTSLDTMTVALVQVTESIEKIERRVFRLEDRI